MNPNHSVTHKDIAEAVGVSTYVVSKALSGKAGVAQATRDKVLEVAEKLGYQRNTVASLLASQRHRGGVVGQRPVVTLLHSNEHSFFAKYQIKLFRSVCKDMGLEARIQGTTDTVNARMLYAQGVDGILLDAHEERIEPKVFDAFGWDTLPVVKLGRGYASLRCHLVRLSAFDFMWHTLRQTYERGYRRIVVMLHDSASPQDDSARLGALLAFAEEYRSEGVELRWQRSAPSAYDTTDKVIAWLRSEPADVCVFDHWGFAAQMAEAGVTFPGEMGCAAAMIPDDLQSLWPGLELSLAGCLIQEKEKYLRGLKILSEQIGRNERGLLMEPMESVIEPNWRDGVSLPNNC